MAARLVAIDGRSAVAPSSVPSAGSFGGPLRIAWRRRRPRWPGASRSWAWPSPRRPPRGRSSGTPSSARRSRVAILAATLGFVGDLGRRAGAGRARLGLAQRGLESGRGGGPSGGWCPPRGGWHSVARPSPDVGPTRAAWEECGDCDLGRLQGVRQPGPVRAPVVSSCGELLASVAGARPSSATVVRQTLPAAPPSRSAPTAASSPVAATVPAAPRRAAAAALRPSPPSPAPRPSSHRPRRSRRPPPTAAPADRSTGHAGDHVAAGRGCPRRSVARRHRGGCPGRGADRSPKRRRSRSSRLPRPGRASRSTGVAARASRRLPERPAVPGSWATGRPRPRPRPTRSAARTSRTRPGADRDRRTGSPARCGRLAASRLAGGRGPRRTAVVGPAPTGPDRRGRRGLPRALGQLHRGRLRDRRPRRAHRHRPAPRSRRPPPAPQRSAGRLAVPAELADWLAIGGSVLVDRELRAAVGHRRGHRLARRRLHGRLGAGEPRPSDPDPGHPRRSWCSTSSRTGSRAGSARGSCRSSSAASSLGLAFAYYARPFGGGTGVAVELAGALVLVGGGLLGITPERHEPLGPERLAPREPLLHCAGRPGSRPPGAVDRAAGGKRRPDGPGHRADRLHDQRVLREPGRPARAQGDGRLPRRDLARLRLLGVPRPPGSDRQPGRALLVAAIVILFTPVFFILAVIVYRIVRPHERIGEVNERALAEEALLNEVEAVPHCPGCRRRVNEEWLICPTCRTRLNRVCPNCSRLVGLDWSLCAWCGRDFERREVARSAAVTRAGPDARLRAGRPGGHREAGPARPGSGRPPRAPRPTRSRSVDRAGPRQDPSSRRAPPPSRTRPRARRPTRASRPSRSRAAARRGSISSAGSRPSSAGGSSVPRSRPAAAGPAGSSSPSRGRSSSGSGWWRRPAPRGSSGGTARTSPTAGRRRSSSSRRRSC